MTRTLQATVNPRLLSKADRLFTGTLQGRIIEVLQNARRAGATEVHITNANGQVCVRDNGTGIEDFQNLLDLGGSGWDDNTGLEASEDPAGVGLFCLAPRKVIVRSRGRHIQIDKAGWSGAPVAIVDDSEASAGTELTFPDECWAKTLVEPLAVFTGMRVTVDHQACTSKDFLDGDAHHEFGLGCRIQINTTDELSPWHRQAAREGAFGYTNVLVNFHGQTVGFTYQPVDVPHIQYLVDLTGDPTGIRLMLPARTRLVENAAFKQLKDALERETYRYLQRGGTHLLPYKQYLRAHELGIDLPESEPVYQVGLLTDDGYGVEPAKVQKPEGFDLSNCYRFDQNIGGDDSAEANVHLLAALGTFEKPFIPVCIRSAYDGYRWADLPRVQKVEVKTGRERLQDWVWNGQLICIDDLTIEAHASDGAVFMSIVCMAVAPPRQIEGKPVYSDDEVYITPKARDRLRDMEVWHHLGGFNDNGDTWDTQEYEFGKELEAFWARLEGPDELARRQLCREARCLGNDWRTVSIHADGRVVIIGHGGSSRTVAPPKDTQGGAR